MSKSMKQLTLDYFSGKLAGIKNDIKNGKVDPLQPLTDYIDAFQTLPEDRVVKLPEFVSLFATLCDILDYKVQAFKALMFDISKDKLTRFFQDAGAIDDLVDMVAWRDPFEFTSMSWPFVKEIVEKLGTTRRLVPQCEVVDDEGSIQLQFDLPVENQNFFQEKAAILEALKRYDRLQGSMLASLGNILDFLENDHDIDRMQAFVHVLHLIQDGELILREDDDSSSNTELRLWRDGQ
ncbi:MAG TPA: hypothetical protein VKM55_03170 [Candidatus Lokiarchaeia archaeon]|nr:hypothetical protein [Candidatus Lokiarchaeia archaeon]